jgi:hypothetical protein
MTTTKSTKVLNILLWVAQGMLALLFLWAAYTKLLQPIEETAKMLPWAADNPFLVKLTGFVELLGALGLLLPAALRIQPGLTILAAYGTVALMATAIVFHITRGEASLIGMNIFFMLIAFFIVWGRTSRAPIKAK